MTLVTDTIDGRGLSNKARRGVLELLPNNSGKVILCQPFIS